MPILLAQVKVGDIFWMRLNKFSIYCAKDNKFQRTYRIIYWTQYKNEYDIHEVSEQVRFNLTDKIDPQRGENHVALSLLSTKHGRI